MGIGKGAYGRCRKERISCRQSRKPPAVLEAMVPWLASDHLGHEQDSIQQGKLSRTLIHLLWAIFGFSN